MQSLRHAKLKQDWHTKWNKCKDFDTIYTRKTESRSQRKDKTKSGMWLTADGVYKEEGWTEDNQNTPTGQRAAARAEAVLAACRALGKRWMRTDPQTGERLFNRVKYSDVETSGHEQSINTHQLKKSKIEDVNIGITCALEQVIAFEFGTAFESTLTRMK